MYHWILCFYTSADCVDLMQTANMCVTFYSPKVLLLS